MILITVSQMFCKTICPGSHHFLTERKC